MEGGPSPLGAGRHVQGSACRCCSSHSSSSSSQLSFTFLFGCCCSFVFNTQAFFFCDKNYKLTLILMVCFMHCAKVCNSSPSSAAVVASVASVLCLYITVLSYATVLCRLIRRWIHWTWSKLCYKTLATAISRPQNCVTEGV